MTNTAETAELARLRARVAELESELSGAEPHERKPRGASLRATAAAVLVVLACVLTPFSVVAVWSSTQISDTEEYVQTVAPLVDDPAVQRAVADEVTATILARLDVEGVTDDLLATIADRPRVPPRLALALPALAVPITDGIGGFVRDKVGAIVASPTFATVWTQANRAAHEQLVKLLEGNAGGVVTAQDGAVTLHLAPIIAEVKQRLVAQGFSLANNIPAIDRSLVLVRSDAVTNAQVLYRVLNSLGTWLPVIVLLLLVSGVFVARSHRRALLMGALGVAGAMLTLGVLLALGRVFYLDAVPSSTLPDDAAASVFDTLVRFLRSGIRATATLALVAALGAFLVGPSGTALRIRRVLASGLSSIGNRAESAGWNAGRPGAWTAAHKRPVELGVIVLGALALTFWTQPTTAVVLVVAVLVLVVVVLVELLAAIAPHPADIGADTPTAGGEVARHA
jgi:uncharacterized membrane protein